MKSFSSSAMTFHYRIQKLFLYEKMTFGLFNSKDTRLRNTKCFRITKFEKKT